MISKVKSVLKTVFVSFPQKGQYYVIVYYSKLKIFDPTHFHSAHHLAFNLSTNVHAGIVPLLSGRLLTLHFNWTLSEEKATASSATNGNSDVYITRHGKINFVDLAGKIICVIYRISFLVLFTIFDCFTNTFSRNQKFICKHAWRRVDCMSRLCGLLCETETIKNKKYSVHWI